MGLALDHSKNLQYKTEENSAITVENLRSRLHFQNIYDLMF